MTAFVLDASVTMRWCFDAGTHDYADGMLRQLSSAGGEAFVPVLWRYEVSAVLARAQLRGTVSPEEAVLFLEDLGAMHITVDAESADHALTDVYRLAVQHGLTSYDAAYLELALRRGLPLATLDAELIHASKTAGVAVL